MPRLSAALASAAVLGAGLLGGAGLAVASAGAAAAGTMPSCGAPVTSGTTATVTCSYSGAAQYFTVPAGVTSATFTLDGAAGGAAAYQSAAGGLGAEVTATLAVTPGTMLQVNVGQQGASAGEHTFGGGGAGSGTTSGAGGSGDGGGATDVRTPASDGSYPVTDRVLIAGGGGGGGYIGGLSGSVAVDGGAGGNAGAAGSGGQSVDVSGAALGGGAGGGAGTATGAGAGGAGGTVTGTSGCSAGAHPGTVGAPGESGATQGVGGDAPSLGNGGAGGGGYYGGGGGGDGAADNCSGGGGSGGGGGGGSSYAAPSATGVTVTDGASAPSTGNGTVVISYLAIPPLSVTTTALPGATVGSAYTATLAATGGVKPYTWSVTSGALPAGLSLDPSTGVISGAALVPGGMSITVTVTDSASPAVSASRVLTLTTGGCQHTVTGPRRGPLAIGAGVTCVIDATITGPVRIANGAVVVVTGSRVTGPVRAAGAAQLAVCGTTVTGPVSVTGSTGLVLLGGEAGCGTDTVRGPVFLSGNSGGLVLSGAAVTGPVDVAENSGPPMRVAGNQVAGPLSCSGNTPAPEDGGQPNTVTGPASGQCAGLT